MNDQEYITAVAEFTKCREQMIQLAVGLDYETSERNPLRWGDANFLDVFSRRDVELVSITLQGIAEHSVKTAIACRKLTRDDLIALHLDSNVPELPPVGIPPTLEAKTDTPFIQELKRRIFGIKRE